MTDPYYIRTMTLSELYNTVYKSKPPIIDGLIYLGVALAFETLVDKGLYYSKGKGKLHWRLLTQSSINVIGDILPHPFRKYISSYNFTDNKLCSIKSLVSSILKLYRKDIQTFCNGNLEDFVTKLLKEHSDITTPEKFMSYLNSSNCLESSTNRTSIFDNSKDRSSS